MIIFMCMFYRLFDSDKVQSLVTKWVGFYKTYRDILTSDIVHVRRPDMQGNHAAAVVDYSHTGDRHKYHTNISCQFKVTGHNLLSRVRDN